MKDKILSAIKAALGKTTSINDKTLSAYVAIIAAQITDENQISEAIKPYVEVLKEFQGNINSVAAAAASAKETELKTAKEKAEAEAAAKKAAEEEAANGSGSDLDAKLQAMFDAKVKPIQDELAAYKAKEATTERQNSITAKAKELGIPEERIKQGFVIAEDADDAAIGEYLSGIATYEKSRELPFGNRFPLQSSDKITDEEAKAIADKMIV